MVVEPQEGSSGSGSQASQQNIVIASAAAYSESSQRIHRQTVVYQRIALFDERCCNDSLRNTHVNKTTPSLTPGAAVSRDHGP